MTTFVFNRANGARERLHRETRRSTWPAVCSGTAAVPAHHTGTYSKSVFQVSSNQHTNTTSLQTEMFLLISDLLIRASVFWKVTWRRDRMLNIQLFVSYLEFQWTAELYPASWSTWPAWAARDHHPAIILYCTPPNILSMIYITFMGGSKVFFTKK